MATRASKMANVGELELRAAAEKFAASNKVWAAIQKATTSREAFDAAERNPEVLFASEGAKLPKGLALEVFSHPPRQLPGPDWFPFVLEFHSCRNFWVRECDDSSPPRCTFKEQTICFGFRVRPRFPFPRV